MSNPITFAALEKVLIQLGFALDPDLEHRIFWHDVKDAMIALPGYRPEQIVQEGHLVVVRVTIEGRGVATRETLERLLAAASGPTHRAKPRTREITHVISDDVKA